MTDMIKRRYIVVKRPGRVPDKKRPIQTNEGVIEMLRELRTLYPDAALLLCEITWDDDLWVTDGDEEISIANHLAKANIRRCGKCGRGRNSRHHNAVCRYGVVA